jgi:ribose/xylose/arabinose/galactoside ABC-type transport system permease subunit
VGPASSPLRLFGRAPALRSLVSGPIVICLGMILLFSLLSENFFSASNAANIARQASVLALVSFGQTFVILLAGIDLSVGAVMGLTSCVAAFLMLDLHLAPALAALAGVALASLCGLANGLVHSLLGLNPFVPTFGMWGMALGAALILTEERVLTGFPGALRVLHDGELLGLPAPLLIVAGVAGLLHLFLKATPAGIATYAIGGNEPAARLSGIRVTLHKTLVYTFCGFMAGVAGIVFLARSNAAQAVDTIGYEFDSIAAVVVGGTSLAGGKGGVAQTLAGVALIAVLRNGLNMVGVNLYLQLVFIGLVLILAYVTESRSLYGALLDLRRRLPGAASAKEA